MASSHVHDAIVGEQGTSLQEGKVGVEVLVPWPVMRSFAAGSTLSSSACVTCSAISSCTAKMSPVGRSKRIDQTSAPVSVSISCVGDPHLACVSLCTLPSSR